MRPLGPWIAALAVRRPPWTSTPIVLGTFAAAITFSVVALEVVQWATGWPPWSGPAVLGMLGAVAWGASRISRSDWWAFFWDCSLYASMSGALIFAGHLLIPLSDSLVEDAAVTWGTLAALVLWRRRQVARGLRESMEAPINRRHAQPSRWTPESEEAKGGGER